MLTSAQKITLIELAIRAAEGSMQLSFEDAYKKMIDLIELDAEKIVNFPTDQ